MSSIEKNKPDLLEFRGVGLVYPGTPPHRVLDNLDLSVREGGFLTILGPSGCGKSTLLRLAASFLSPTAGEIRFNGTTPRSPDRDRIMVFQSQDQLFPWLSVEENVGFPMKHRGDSSWRRRAGELLELVRLSRWAGHYPHQLSGGMKQRAAIARALSTNPRLLLMDEPFGSVDAQTRLHLQNSLKDLWRDQGVSIIFVTHDIQEAVYLGEEIAVMESDGSILNRFSNPLSSPRTPENPGYPKLYGDIFHRLSPPAGPSR